MSGGLWRDALRQLRTDRLALASLAILLVLGSAAVAGPWLLDYREDEIDWANMAVPPLAAGGHWLGTDRLGRDLLVRTLFGLRVSMAIALAATLISLVIGVGWGALAGYLRGRADALMMRFVDVLYSLPLIFFIIILVTVFGRNIFLVFVAIGAVEWLTMSRIVRGQTLTVKAKEYVESAVAIGLSRGAILRRYIIPNVLGPVIVYVTLLIPTNIIVESYLSFLGLGVQEPLTSWGLLISQGAGQLDSAPWLIFFPATFLAITMFCFNFIGDGLRDALDPRDR